MNRIIQIGQAVLIKTQTVLKNLGHKTSVWYKNMSTPATPDGTEDDQQTKRAPGRVSSYKADKIKPIKRNSKERVYRLKGYTTVDKINRKRNSEIKQRFLRRILVIIVSILIIIILFNIYNPFKDLSEMFRILGLDQKSTTTEITYTIATSSETLTSDTAIDVTATSN